MSGCAIGPDGKLLDAKDIVWFKDADSSEPINHATTPLGPSSITTADSFTTIHPFFHGRPAPAAIVAGAHCSGHATHPSIRITNPNNTEASGFVTTHKLKGPITNPNNTEASSSATMHKRKASHSISMAASRRINHKVAINHKGSTDGSEISDYESDVAEHPATSSDNGAGNTKPDEDTDIGFMSTKAMGDADREVSLF